MTATLVARANLVSHTGRSDTAATRALQPHIPRRPPATPARAFHHRGRELPERSSLSPSRRHLRLPQLNRFANRPCTYPRSSLPPGVPSSPTGLCHAHTMTHPPPPRQEPHGPHSVYLPSPLYQLRTPSSSRRNPNVAHTLNLRHSTTWAPSSTLGPSSPSRHHRSGGGTWRFEGRKAASRGPTFPRWGPPLSLLRLSLSLKCSSPSCSRAAVHRGTERVPLSRWGHWHFGARG